MASRLSIDQIDGLASRKGVKRIAVENFLMSADPGMSRHIHCVNLNLDAKLYKWNDATFRAITDGIFLMYQGGYS